MRISILLILAIATIGGWWAMRLTIQDNGHRQSIAGELQDEAKANRPDTNPADHVLESEGYRDAGMRVLFIGNSHTTYHNMPGIVEDLLSSRADADKPAFCYGHGAGGFLQHHARNPMTLALVNHGDWDYVVLQAQKYSTSGQFHYPYDAALELSKIAQANGARVVMFPEWARRDHPDEASRILSLHEEIADQSDSSVAPVPLAWRSALEMEPPPRLHAADGNHCSPLGAYLTACVFFVVLTGENPQSLPVQEPSLISQDDQQIMREIAWQAVSTYRTTDAPGEQIR